MIGAGEVVGPLGAAVLPLFKAWRFGLPPLFALAGGRLLRVPGVHHRAPRAARDAARAWRGRARSNTAGASEGAPVFGARRHPASRRDAASRRGAARRARAGAGAGCSATAASCGFCADVAAAPASCFGQMYSTFPDAADELPARACPRRTGGVLMSFSALVTVIGPRSIRACASSGARPDVSGGPRHSAVLLGSA